MYPVDSVNKICKVTLWIFKYIWAVEAQSKIYGIRTVMEAVIAGCTIDKVFVQKGLQGPLYKELEELLNKENISISHVPSVKLNNLSPGNHQGVVAIMSPIAFKDLESLVTEIIKEKEYPLLLLLDGITDVRNMGAIIRTAACTGVDGIVLPVNGSAPITGDTVKTSAGAVFQVPIAKVPHIKDAIYYLQAEGITVIAATEKASEEVYEVDLKRPLALIMGSEERGVNPSVLKIVDHKVCLPMTGTIESLNVSVASGVFLYEILRQRR